jgi:hypothetical protein
MISKVLDVLVLVTVQGINWCLSLLSLLEEAIRKNLTE